MNISSVIIQCNMEHLDEVIDALKNSDFCEYHLHNKKGQIVITIEGEGVEEEIAKLTKIKAFPNILSAEMVYSYAEKELEQERDKLVKESFPEWLNDPEVTAKDIKYGGDLKGRF